MIMASSLTAPMPSACHGLPMGDFFEMATESADLFCMMTHASENWSRLTRPASPSLVKAMGPERPSSASSSWPVMSTKALPLPGKVLSSVFTLMRILRACRGSRVKSEHAKTLPVCQSPDCESATTPTPATSWLGMPLRQVNLPLTRSSALPIMFMPRTAS
jgi:hypothetical protein